VEVSVSDFVTGEFKARAPKARPEGLILTAGTGAINCKTRVVVKSPDIA
jgi:hypothetical protein